MQQESVNKSIILDFYRRAVAQGDIAFAEEIIADDYIQHSPLVKPGKAGLLEALTYTNQMPKPATTSAPFMRLIAEGEYVVTNMCFEWDGKQKAVLDLFRFQDGKISEHWDAIQDQPATSLNDNALMDGPMPRSDRSDAAANKRIIQGLFRNLFEEKNPAKLADYVAADLVQHRADMADGLAGLITYWQQTITTLQHPNVQRIIGEADFVVIQYNATITGQTIMFYDIFRLNGKKIVEQWGLKQAIS